MQIEKSDKNKFSIRKRIVYSLRDSCQINGGPTRGYAVYVFIVYLIFLREFERYVFSSRRVGIYRNVFYLVIMPMLSPGGYNSMFMMVQPLSLYDARFCT